MDVGAVITEVRNIEERRAKIRLKKKMIHFLVMFGV